LPKGNNYYGKDITDTNLPQKAIAASVDSDGKINCILTGNGRESWYHDGTFAGISEEDYAKLLDAKKALDEQANLLYKYDKEAASRFVNAEGYKVVQEAIERGGLPRRPQHRDNAAAISL